MRHMKNLFINGLIIKNIIKNIDQLIIFYFLILHYNLLIKKD